MIKNKFSPHVFSLSALFVLGGAVISMPFYTLGLVSLLIFGVLSLLLVWFSTVLLNLGQKNKTAFYIAAVIVTAAAIFGAASAFLDFFAFLKAVALPKTNTVFLLVALGVLVVLFCINKWYAIYKYSLFTAVICGAIIIICFLGGIKNFDFKGLALPLTVSFKLKDLLKCVLPVIVLPFFTDCKKRHSKPIFLGVAVAFLSVAICLLQSVFTFHAQNDLSFPYLRAVSVISSGSLFTRLDGLVYFLFFASALVRVTVCIKTINVVLSSIKSKIILYVKHLLFHNTPKEKHNKMR